MPISGACVSKTENPAELVLTPEKPADKLSKADEEFFAVVRADIARAQRHLEDLPYNQRRGLSLDTLRHFGCGFLKDWIHPNYCVPGQEKEFKRQNRQRRIIIPTPNHYNAVILDCDRTAANRDWHKMHTRGIELFNETALLSDAEIIIVVEGEFDTMSIWQASKGTIAAVGCIGGNKKYLLEAIGKLGVEGKKFLILFDDDKKDDGKNPGQEHAAALMDALIRQGIPAVNCTFNELMTADELKACADSKGKIDANQILQRLGDEFLNQLLVRIIDDCRADFELVALKIAADKEARKASLKTAKSPTLPAPTKKSATDARINNEDVEKLLAEVNSISADALAKRGYLQHTDKGGSKPNGYVCPFCGSGTHKDKSGALSFYEASADNHFCCHSCGEGGDVVKFLAAVYGKSARGKEFFEVLKQAADEFGIDYDADKISPPAQAVFDERLTDFQAHFGEIDAKLFPKIEAAKAFIDALKPETFTADLPFDIGVRDKVALCKFYLPEFAQKFFDTLKAAKHLAAEKIKALRAQKPPAVVPADLQSLANLAQSKIEKEIDSLASILRTNHKSFLADRNLALLNADRKAQQQALQRLNESTATNVKGCPLDLKIPEYCQFNETGVSIIDFSGRFPKTLKAAQTPLVPVKILREPSSHATQYEVAVKSKGFWRSVVVDGDELADSKKILRLAKDGGALIEDAKCLTKYFARIIKANEDKLPEINCFTQPGWHGRDFSFFAYPTGGDNYIVRRAGFDYDVIFSQRGDPALWKETFRRVFDCGALVRVFLGFALGACLVRPLNILNPQIHLSAPNDSGKSGLLKFAASIFGNPSEMMKTFAATPKNSISVASASNDFPSLFDELETIKKSNENTLSQMIYEFAQGVANQANKRDGTPRPAVRFKGAKLSTAERPLLKSHDQRGAFKRLVQLDTRGRLFNPELAAEIHLISENNFGFFGRAWVLDFVVPHLNEIRDKYLEFSRLYANLPTRREVEPTLLKFVTVAALAAHFFAAFIGIEPSFDNVKFIHDINELIAMLPTPSELDDSTRALSDLQSFVAAHYNFFMHEVKDKPTLDNEFSQKAFECYGKIFINGEVAFFPTALKKILETELGFASMDALIAEWAQKGFLRCTKGRGYRFSTKINGLSIPAIRFKAEILFSNSEERGFTI